METFGNLMLSQKPMILKDFIHRPVYRGEGICELCLIHMHRTNVNPSTTGGLRLLGRSGLTLPNNLLPLNRTLRSRAVRS